MESSKRKSKSPADQVKVFNIFWLEKQFTKAFEREKRLSSFVGSTKRLNFDCPKVVYSSPLGLDALVMAEKFCCLEDGEQASQQQEEMTIIRISSCCEFSDLRMNERLPFATILARDLSSDSSYANT
ncbi:hypothetical protein AVEN_195081-1 [Araneus ventricosus]|uniref:Uncharacterized protein n=1 Tax=Araneus ventricosus TaxID=182803 RepID=A0A4Y2BIF7_ARAVE|nr:hypothetical protein AVEN_195081-1 [Araneus ventricosus]